MNQDVLAGSQPTVSLGAVLEGVAERLQARFTALVSDLPTQTAESRPSHLLQFLHDARQQLLRAAALLHDPRKLPPLYQLVQAGGVLDISANHARALQTTADELFKANGMLMFQRVPLFNVPDAMDVLATGTYSNLPASIQDMRGPRLAAEQEQQRLLNQLNHLLYEHLMKAHLPESLKLVEVTGGYAVLSCAGLYEVQLTLFQQPYPPQVAEARQAAAAAAAAPTGSQGQQQADEQQAQQLQQPAAQQEVSAADAEGPSTPEVRWQWTLTAAQLLPGAAKLQPLQPVQLEQLLRNVRERMWLAADAAAIKAAQQAGAAAAGQQPPQDADQGALQAQQPTMSGATTVRSGPTFSTVSGVSGAAGAAADPGRGLQLAVYGADEVALPLRVMHAVLRDVTAQMLLQEVRHKAQQLAGPRSKWEGHLKIVRAEQLTPGIRMLYWQRSPALLPLNAAHQPDAAAAAGAGGGGAGVNRTAAAAATTTAGGLPAIEVGVGRDGTVQEVHVPALQLPGAEQEQQLVLDSHTVDIVGLLLQAVRAVIATQLRVLCKLTTRQLEQTGVSDSLQLRLCCCGHLARFSEQQQQQEQRAQALALPAAGAADTQELPDTLEVLLECQAALTITFQPWSGQLVLRCGSAYGGDGNLEMGLTVHQVQEALRSKQDSLYQRLLQQRQQAARGNFGSIAAEQQQQQQQQLLLPLEQQHQQIALACMQELSTGLTQLCLELLNKLRHNSFVTAARMLSLNLSHHLKTALHQQQQRQVQVQSPHAVARSAAVRGAQSIFLAMPVMQLPAYMLLLAAGSWCGQHDAAAVQLPGPAGAGQQLQAASGTAAGVHGVPARVATLSPALCMSFPRRAGAGNSDGLVLMLCNTQGLPGQVLKEVRVPAQRCALAAAQALERREQQRQQQQEQAAGATVMLPGVPAGHQQQQRQLDAHVAQLSAALEFSKARLTYERLLLELAALQVLFEEELPLQPAQGTAQVQSQANQQHGSQQAQQPQGQQHQQDQGPSWPQPCIRLVSLPGCDLYQQLERPMGCRPVQVGLKQVWIECGPHVGQWSVHLTGRLYSQQPQQVHSAASKVPEVTAATGMWCWQYNFWAGDDVRTALLQLQQLLHMQRFLATLEHLALGCQELDVADSASGWWPGNSSTAGEELSSAAAAAGPACGAAAAVRKAPEERQEWEDAADGRPAKRPCQRSADGQPQLQPDGLGQTANGSTGAGPLLNGMVRPDDVPSQLEQAAADASNATLQQHLHANGLQPPAAAQPVGDASCNGIPGKHSRGGSSSACGLLWHWAGTGLVRLAGYSCMDAVLECGKPLAAPGAAPGSAPGPGGNGLAPDVPDNHHQHEQQQQQQRQQAPKSSRVQFHVCWQPLYSFGGTSQQPSTVQPSVGRGGRSRPAWPSSSSVPAKVSTQGSQQQQQVQQPQQQLHTHPDSSRAALTPEVLLAEDVLGVACCISCSSPNIPRALLSQLADMVNSGCIDLLLDALAVLGWPLSQLRWLLSQEAPTDLAARLALSSKVCGAWWPSVVSSTPTDTFWHLRVTFGAELVAATDAPLTQQQSKGEGTPAPAAAGLSRHWQQQLLLDFAMMGNGNVRVVLRQAAAPTAGAAGAGAAAGGAAPVSPLGGKGEAASGSGTASAAEYAQDVVLAAYKHLKSTQPHVTVLLAFGSCSWQQKLLPQFQGAAPDNSSNSARRPPLSGFWVRVRDLHTVMPSVIDVWAQRVTDAAAADQARAAAAAAAAAADQARTAAAAAEQVRAAAAAAASAAASALTASSGQQPAQQMQQQQQQQQQGQPAQLGQHQQQLQPQLQPQSALQQPALQQQGAVQQMAQAKPEQQQPQQQLPSQVPQGQQQPGGLQGLQHAQQQQQHMQQQQQAVLHAQQMMMAQQAKVQAQAQGVASGANVAFSNAPAGTAAGGAGMPVCVPMAPAALMRPVTLTVPVQTGYMQQGVVGGRVTQHIQVVAPHTSAGMVPGPGWVMTMPAVQQQQHPASQQHRQ